MYNKALQNNYSLNSMEYGGDYVQNMAPVYGYNNSIVGELIEFLGDMISLLMGMVTVLIVVFCIFEFIKLLVNIKGVGAEAAAKTATKDFKDTFMWSLNKVTGIFSFMNPIWNFGKKIKWIAAILLFCMISVSFAQDKQFIDMVDIKTGQVMINMKNQTIIYPGKHMISPYFNQYILVHTANYSFEIPEITADSSEPQDIGLHVGVTFRLDIDKIFDFYKREGVISIAQTTDSIVSPKSIEAIKNVVKEYSYKDILSEQVAIKETSLIEINKILTPLGLQVTDLTFINIVIPRGYVDKIEELELLSESLEIEQQRLAEAKLVTQTELEFANREKQKSIIEAEGIAEANRITSQQVLTDNILELKKLEIQKSLIEKWDGVTPTSTGDNFSIINQ